ncbi:pseudouridine synthase [Fomitiporia mediterranea MF3/22]|uniref:pseudouridine synthase n=1 Tax=Fomitiporia mediterranea (strain MF3/22) TaxID=694068 RepID=UPI000440856E|nr:pseudouridine synthase [Fomitiporia mediterranea MF3/22]EJD08351.1 pseudouridine synthase [Fomitiporia mediterranea MF3/22]
MTSKGRPGLKKIPAYWYPYRTNAKARWFDREILEVISTEFRDRSVEYYRYALQSGVTTINGEIARPGTLVRNGDTLENIVHRHEPPVTSTPVEILHHDIEREFIVINKPGSIPVHAAGRYFKNSLVEILKDDFGFSNVYTVNRLDRLTSGLMIIALSSERARSLTSEFTSGTIQKEYVARVRGEFPAEEITCEEPLLTVDRQMGLNIVHPEGKEAKTMFKRMHYDKITDTSVVHCRPITGRSHQIRVHLQFLGHPIANDAVYGDARVWGENVAKGGIDITPSEERRAPQPPPGLEDSTAEGLGRRPDSEFVPLTDHESISTGAGSRPAHEEQKKSEPSSSGPNHIPGSLKRTKKRNDRRFNPAWRTKEESAALTAKHTGEAPAPGELPRETGHDIGLGSPVPLSKEAVEIITRLRNQKDEDEDWGRWRDVVFRAKGALTPQVVQLAYAQQNTPPRKSRKKLERQSTKKEPKSRRDEEINATESASAPSPTTITQLIPTQDQTDPVPESSETIELSISTPIQAPTNLAGPENSSDALYCPECYLPLCPDPKPEKLYIFLHALRYTSASLGSFETRLPEWAAEGYVWE